MSYNSITENPEYSRIIAGIIESEQHLENTYRELAHKLSYADETNFMHKTARLQNVRKVCLIFVEEKEQTISTRGRPVKTLRINWDGWMTLFLKNCVENKEVFYLFTTPKATDKLEAENKERILSGFNIKTTEGLCLWGWLFREYVTAILKQDTSATIQNILEGFKYYSVTFMKRERGQPFPSFPVSKADMSDAMIAYMALVDVCYRIVLAESIPSGTESGIKRLGEIMRH